MQDVIRQRLEAKISQINDLNSKKEQYLLVLKELDIELTQAIGAANELNSILKELLEPISPP